MNASYSSQVDGFQTSIHLKKMKNQERRKISPLCNLDSVLIHNLTFIERPVRFRIRLNRLPVGSFFPGSNSMMDIDKDECIANDTHPCTEATVRVHCNHSNEMSLMYSCRCCLDWLLHSYFLVWLLYCVGSFSQKETLIIDIWSHWCLTIWSYRNSCRDHASYWMMLIICHHCSLEKIQESINQFELKSSDVHSCFSFPSLWSSYSCSNVSTN